MPKVYSNMVVDLQSRSNVVIAQASTQVSKDCLRNTVRACVNTKVDNCFYFEPMNTNPKKTSGCKKAQGRKNGANKGAKQT